MSSELEVGSETRKNTKIRNYLEWEFVKLKNIVELSNGKKKPADSTGKIPIYGGNGIMGLTNRANFENVVIVGRVGAYCGSVFYEPSMCWVSDNAIAVKNKDVCDIAYIYYLFINLHLNIRSIGTSQPLLTQEILNSIEIRLPNIKYQRKIARCLRSLDEKIAKNKAINDNLLEQAQILYTSFFVINPDIKWQTGNLSELITIKYGKDHKKLNDGRFPVYGSGGIMRYVEKYLYDKESVLIPRKGTLNNVLYVGSPFWSVDTMFYTEMKVPGVAKFVFHFLKSKDLASMNSGSAVPSMTIDILNSLKLRIPDLDTLNKFELIVSPMFRMIEHNVLKNQRLTELRDALLPRLMSGEIDVSEVEI